MFNSSIEFSSIDQFEAARTGNLAWFQHRSTAGTLPDLTRASGNEGLPLEIATTHGHLPVVRYLIEESGQLINATSEDNAALRLAVENDHLHSVRYLIDDSGQPVDATANNNFASRSAAAHGYLQIFRYLFEESGQLIDATTSNNIALQRAATNGHSTVVQYLESVILIIEAIDLDLFRDSLQAVMPSASSKSTAVKRHI
jgi:ankyrin repeat protein